MSSPINWEDPISSKERGREGRREGREGREEGRSGGREEEEEGWMERRICYITILLSIYDPPMFSHSSILQHRYEEVM